MAPKRKRKSKASSEPSVGASPAAALIGKDSQSAQDHPPSPSPPTNLWTSDHALVRHVSLRGRALVPIITTPHHNRPEIVVAHGGTIEATVDIACFHPEDIRQRQSALWRGHLIPPPMKACTEEDTTAGQQDKPPSTTSEHPQLVLPRAVDVISSDLTNRTFSLFAPMPTMHLKSLEDRLFRVIYQRVVEHHMPLLILTAACEEIQSQYLKHYQQQQQSTSSSSGGGDRSSASTKKGWNSKPPEYYSKTPNSYLVPPVSATTASKIADSASNDKSSQQFPSFTPSQLNSRIKQGCALMWKHYCDHYYHPPPPPLPPPPPSSLSSSGTAPKDAAPTTAEMSSSWDRRRSSSRIARQQHLMPPPDTSSASTGGNVDAAEHNNRENNNSDGGEPSPYWKVLSGGKVALHLYDQLLPKKKSSSSSSPPPPPPPMATTQDPESETSLNNPTSTTATAASGTAQLPPSAERVESTSKELMPDTNTASTLTPAIPPSPMGPTSADEAVLVPNDIVGTAAVNDIQDSSSGTTPAKESTAATEVAVEPVETTSIDVPPTTTASTHHVNTDDSTKTLPDDAAKPQQPKSPKKAAEKVDDNEINDDLEGQADDNNTEDDDDEDFAPPMDDDDDEHEREDDEAMKKVRFVKENVQELVSEAKSTAAKTSAATSADATTEEPTTGETADDPEGVGDSDDEEMDEDVALVMKNPYFNPTAPAVLEFLGRKTAKLLTVSDLQEVIPNMLYKSKKKAKKPTGVAMDDFLTDLDRQVWNKIDDAVPVTATGDSHARVALKLTHEHEDENVERWETSYFARTQLTIRFLDERGKLTLAKPDEHLEELWDQYKERKAWDKWRYKSIHGGYAIWPSWMDAVRQRLSGSAKSAKQGSTIEHSVASAATTETNNDYAVAQALAQEAAAGTDGTGRRTTRRGGDSSGVFYGNQSNMTQKQLMDTILRLISERGYQTAASLVAAVPDESSDPLRRIRGALGKLVWKRNQVSKLEVRSDWTDEPLLRHLTTQPIKMFVEDDVGPVPEEAAALSQYLNYLHETELRLRQLVLERMARLPIVVLATAADERPGSMEALDSAYFNDPSTIQWHRTGHNLLGTAIFRPSDTVNSNEQSVCRWYRITSFCESVASTQVEDEGNPLDRPNIGLAKEAKTVERRMRFQASPIRSPDDAPPGNGSDPGALLLTEAQVYAGVKAAELERQDSPASAKDKSRNPFADGSESQVTLFPVNDTAADHQIHGAVAGHDTCTDVETGEMYYRILVVPQGGESMWVRMETQPDGSFQCFIDGRDEVFSIQQFDYHSSSPAFRECQAIVQFLQRHPKAGPFLVPVDPIALKIPQYNDIVKNPMDISTLSQKLERGQYSNIGPGQTTGLSPVARMLNGPFRKDVELIFDNAMLFNPPDDWIYLAAGAVKKAVIKKIEQAAAAADQKTYKQAVASKSIYVDYDSDVDMYVYESDQDDDFVSSSRRKRKRSATQQVLKEDTSTRVVERPFRLQKILSESTGLRGPLSDFPLSSNAASFTLPCDWTCRYSTASSVTTDVPPVDRDGELDELLSLQKQLEENETTGQRRSTRSHDHGDEVSGDRSVASKSTIEYVPVGSLAGAMDRLPTNRVEVEYERERLHEEYFCKLWRDHHKNLHANLEETFGLDSNLGSYSDGSFPPYLGRVVPLNGPNAFIWEIREPFVIAAVRWVLRGLIQSEHLSESESMSADSLFSGSVLINNVYTLSDGEPFEELDVRELTRRKRADQEAPSSEDEVELSEYEKLRLERVARNEERLRALGLA